MTYKKIEAFKHANGTLFESEEKAIEADIAEIIQCEDKEIAEAIFMKAGELLPLIQRAIAINSAARATRPATEVTSKKVAGEPLGEPKKMTGAELDEEGHNPSCRARATGFKKDCNCNGPGKGLSR